MIGELYKMKSVIFDDVSKRAQISFTPLETFLDERVLLGGILVFLGGKDLNYIFGACWDKMEVMLLQALCPQTI